MEKRDKSVGVKTFLYNNGLFKAEFDFFERARRSEEDQRDITFIRTIIDQAVKDIVGANPGNSDREAALEFFCTSVFDSYCYAVGKNPWDVLETIDNFFEALQTSHQGKNWVRPKPFKQTLIQIPGVYYGIFTTDNTDENQEPTYRDSEVHS
jgi:hypothetical protein